MFEQIAKFPLHEWIKDVSKLYAHIRDEHKETLEAH